MRLIDADALVLAFQKEGENNPVKRMGSKFDVGYHNGFVLGVAMAEAIVRDSPHIDAVSVVRCKDCTAFVPMKLDEIFDCFNGKCDVTDGLVCHDDFCSLGKRRADDERGSKGRCERC